MSFDYSDILNQELFQLSKEQKNIVFLTWLNQLHLHHLSHCEAYNAIDRKIFKIKHIDQVEKTPFLPVRLFKELDLKSVPEEDVFKVLKSSGTSGQTPSKIYIDKLVADIQRKALSKITASFLGASRLPMLIIDAKKTLRDPKSFSARGAGILGFSMFGKDTTYALNDNMELDLEAIESFIARHQSSRIFVFGFTSIIQEYFIDVLEASKKSVSLENAVVIHGGGWKKLVDRGLSNADFKKSLLSICNISSVSNYYGMIEQTGSIFFECSEGVLHASEFSDILIRDKDFKVLPNGKRGMIQLISLIPTSYPGYSILTEDEGIIHSEDDCICGRKGKYFSVIGRLKNAEIRGCSDTFNK